MIVGKLKAEQLLKIAAGEKQTLTEEADSLRKENDKIKELCQR